MLTDVNGTNSTIFDLIDSFNNKSLYTTKPPTKNKEVVIKDPDATKVWLLNHNFVGLSP